MKAIYLLPVILLLANISSANELIVSYAPSATVKGDTDESELNVNPYSRLNLNSGAANGVRWVPSSELFYVDFTLIDSGNDVQGDHYHDYKSLSAGLRFIKEGSINETLKSYLGCNAGVGVTEFDVEEGKIRSMAEASFKGGLVFKDTFIIGPEVKFQFIGSPGETVARVLAFNLNAGIRF